MFARRDGRLQVVEYTELGAAEASSSDPRASAWLVHMHTHACVHSAYTPQKTTVACASGMLRQAFTADGAAAGTHSGLVRCTRLHQATAWAAAGRLDCN